MKFIDQNEVELMLEDMYNQVMSSLNSGSKHVLFAMPTGCGKSKFLIRIAKSLSDTENFKAIIVVHEKNLAEQYMIQIKDLGINLSVFTYEKFVSNNLDYYSDITHIFIDRIYKISRNRLSEYLEKYDGTVISASNLIEQW